MKKYSLAVLAFVLLAARPAFAAPSLWHVKGAKGDAYILGSVHILPPDMDWRSPQIAAAMKRADVFVFEVPQNDDTITRLQGLIASQGYLPEGQSLRGQLPETAQAEYDAALEAAGLSPAAVDRQRPWLAALQILMAQLARHGYGAQDGVDGKVLAEAGNRESRYLETIEQQFALLAPTDRKLEMEEFLASLKDLRDAAAEIQPMVAAWQAGDQHRLDQLINGDLEKFPAVRKALLDDRNQTWLGRVRALLRENRTFFITVGAGHLTGPKGLPALLRQAGFRVEGP